MIEFMECDFVDAWRKILTIFIPNNIPQLCILKMFICHECFVTRNKIRNFGVKRRKRCEKLGKIKVGNDFS